MEVQADVGVRVIEDGCERWVVGEWVRRRVQAGL
jgi:hypothetical protein